jgi:pantoate kinase
MLKAFAFAPGHISGFFEPIYNQDLAKSGSRGAGINLTLGSLSEVSIEKSSNQQIYTFINGKKANASVTKLAIKFLIGNKPLKIKVLTKNNLPFGQGFGISAASALSATYALSKLIGISKNDAMKASHFAEVTLRTGLGDVMASCFGGIEIRKSPGLPPWGVIEHIPGQFELVLCIIGKKFETKKVLEDPNKSAVVVDYGKFCIKKMIESPSVENLFHLSQSFTKKTNLADKTVIDAIEAANRFGLASMCMLGNSIFAMGKTNELCNILTNFGKVIVCGIDEVGARVLQ